MGSFLHLVEYHGVMRFFSKKANMTLGRMLILAVVMGVAITLAVVGIRTYKEKRLADAIAPLVAETTQRVVDINDHLSGSITVGELEQLLDRRIQEINDRHLALTALDGSANPSLRDTGLAYVNAALGYLRASRTRISTSMQYANSMNSASTMISELAGNAYAVSAINRAIDEADAAETSHEDAIRTLGMRKKVLSEQADIARRVLPAAAILSPNQVAILDPSSAKK